METGANRADQEDSSPTRASPESMAGAKPVRPRVLAEPGLVMIGFVVEYNCFAHHLLVQDNLAQKCDTWMVLNACLSKTA